MSLICALPLEVSRGCVPCVVEMQWWEGFGLTHFPVVCGLSGRSTHVLLKEIVRGRPAPTRCLLSIPLVFSLFEGKPMCPSVYS